MANLVQTERYLKERVLYPSFISTLPAHDLCLTVVIPARDEPDLLLSLHSLLRCILPKGHVEVLVVFNESECDAPSLRLNHQAAIESLRDWAESNHREGLDFHFLHPPPLPKKHAGVGLARKIGMDESVRRLPSEGVIACFDADSQCATNYLVEICRHFSDKPKCQAASIHFEHPLTGNSYSDRLYHAITEYELHLRYFIEAQRWAGLPFAYQTIGSSMAVRSSAYQAQNGMNRRQAGEDFYFLHKYTTLGPDSFSEINSTCIVPSPRVSDRVPFGTGKAVGSLLESTEGQQTYHPKTFQDLKVFIDDIGKSDLPESITAFLEQIDFPKHLAEIRANTTSIPAFRNRFFRWFDAFQVMKFAHFARDRFYPDQPVKESAEWLANRQYQDSKEALLHFRKIHLGDAAIQRATHTEN